MTRANAYAKLNLALVVGPLREDGKHEVVTVLQAIDLADEISLEPADGLAVEGFEQDTLVHTALEVLARTAGVAPAWRVRITKRIPVAAGLGGGSSDAAAALRLANDQLDEPLASETIHELAAGVGADAPFFLRDGPQLATGDGTELTPLALPTDYFVLVLLPGDERKSSTADVYSRFDRLDGAEGYDERRSALLQAVDGLEHATDLARLPRNDLASAPLADDLVRLGAFRADVTGAGPAVYGLFEREPDARRAAASLRRAGTTLLAHPVRRLGQPAR